MPRTFVWHPGRGPKQTKKNELTTGKVRIRQVRSGIGHSWRGQLKQVRHLIEVEPVEE